MKNQRKSAPQRLFHLSGDLDIDGRLHQNEKAPHFAETKYPDGAKLFREE